MTIGNRVTAIPGVARLSALEIDPRAAAQAYRDRIVGPVRGVLPDTVVRGIEEQLSGACTTEIAAFDEFTGLLTELALLVAGGARPVGAVPVADPGVRGAGGGAAGGSRRPLGRRAAVLLLRHAQGADAADPGCHGRVPEDFMVSIMGRRAWWSVPAAVLIGVPLYTNAAGVIPIVQALLAKGAASMARWFMRGACPAATGSNSGWPPERTVTGARVVSPRAVRINAMTMSCPS